MNAYLIQVPAQGANAIWFVEAIRMKRYGDPVFLLYTSDPNEALVVSADAYDDIARLLDRQGVATNPFEVSAGTYDERKLIR
jgi:hypothetical protein